MLSGDYISTKSHGAGGVSATTPPQVALCRTHTLMLPCLSSNIVCYICQGEKCP